VGFLEELRGHCDWFSLLVIGFRRGICYIPHPLAVWRAQQAGSYSAGNRDWIEQREVIHTLIDLLESPTYRDVRLMFQRSGALFFPPHILRALVAERRHWNYLSPIVLRRALCTELRRLVIRSMPFGVKRGLCGLRSRIVGRDPQLRELLAHFR